MIYEQKLSPILILIGNYSQTRFKEILWDWQKLFVITTTNVFVITEVLLDFSIRILIQFSRLDCQFSLKRGFESHICDGFGLDLQLKKLD